MKFNVDEQSDLIVQISRYRSKIVEIWLLRALISGFLTGVATLFALILVSQHIYALPNYVLVFSAIPAIVVFFRKYSVFRRDYTHIPANIDRQLCDNSAF